MYKMDREIHIKRDGQGLKEFIKVFSTSRAGFASLMHEHGVYDSMSYSSISRYEKDGFPELSDGRQWLQSVIDIFEEPLRRLGVEVYYEGKKLN